MTQEKNEKVDFGDFLKLLRIHQWVKNLIIFLPLFFGMKIFDLTLLSKAVFAFIAFSLAASAVYIFNDFCDIEEDRHHPKKKTRPLAAGKIRKGTAVTMTFLLLILGFSTSYFVSLGTLHLLILYLSINVLYSLFFKHVPIIDVFIVATGFVIRLFVGAAAASIHLSMWIILMIFILALFLALAKRRDDVLIFLESGQRTRKSTTGYTLKFLDSAMIMMAAIIVIFYIMYTISPDVTSRPHGDKLYYTTAFVLLGILKYMQIALVKNDSGSPTKILLSDKTIQLLVGSWIIALAFILYG